MTLKNKTDRALRRAEKLVASANVRSLKILEKIGKKMKGSYDPVAVVEALALLDPNWSIERDVGTLAADVKISVSDSIVAMVKHHLIASGVITGDRYGRSDMATVSQYAKSPLSIVVADRPSSGAPADPVAVEKAVRNLFHIGRTGPLDALLATSIVSRAQAKTHYQDAHTTISVKDPAMSVTVWTVKSPNGKTLSLPVPPEGQAPGNPHKMSSPSLWTWLYKTHPEISAQAKSMTDGSGDLETHKKQQEASRKGFAAGNYGHCAVCDSPQKIRSGRMVLHGYARPGTGYIVGACLGVGFPPYELSADGCVYAAAAYKRQLSVLKDDMRKLASSRELRVSDSRSHFLVQRDGTMTPTQRNNDPAPFHYVVDQDPWQAAVDAHARPLKAAAQQYADETKRMLAKIQNWKLTSLPA